MYTNLQQNDRETPGYPNKNRENGYRSPYDPEREWNGYRPRDERERERDYINTNNYNRPKRDWADNREYRPVGDRSPSPKRRKMREDSVDSPFKQRYDSPRYSYRSRSRSPSPSAEKERFPRDYYRERDYSYSRDKDYSRGGSYYDVYPRRRWDNRTSYHRSHYQTFHEYDEYRDSRREYDRDYDREYNDRYRDGRYDNRYRNDFDYDRHRDRDDKERDEYRDRRSRSRSRERSPLDEDRRYTSSSSTITSSVVSPLPATTSSSVSTASTSKYNSTNYYSPRRDAEDDAEQVDSNTTTSTAQPSTSETQEVAPPSEKQENSLTESKEQPSQGQVTTPNGEGSPTEGGNTPQLATPTPKRRLGWGQGLVAFEKKTTPADEKEQENAQATPPKIDIETYMQAQAQALSEVKTTQQELTKPPPLIPEAPIKVERVASPTPMEAEPTSQPALAPAPVQVSAPAPIPVSTPAPIAPPPPETPKITKEEALGIIERLDADINKTEAQIAQLKKPKSQHKHRHLLYQNLAQDIYDENQEKIEQSKEEIEKLLPTSMKNMTEPLYKSPKEVPGINENAVTNIVMKSKIAKVIKQRKTELKVKQEKIKEKYHKLYDTWKKKVQKMEQKRQKQSPAPTKKGPKENHAHTIMQDIEETKRPILRSGGGPGGVRPATPRGRMFPSGDAARSEAEFEQIMLSLREEDDRDPERKYLKTLAKIPAMLPVDEKMPRFIDRIGLIPDPMAVERERKLINPWTEEERQIFLKKFLHYGKFFSRISYYIENKSTADVIWYYYANKKTLDLKKLLRDQQNKRRSWGGRKGFTSPAPPPAPVSGLPRELANLGVTNVSPYWSDRRKPNLLAAEEEIDVHWNESEREMFTEAYEKFAMDFKGIASYLGTKSSVQCKFYYQNYFKNKRSAPEPAEEAKKSNKIARTQSKEDTGKDIVASSSKDDSDEVSSSDEDSPEETTSRKGARIANTWKAEEKDSFLKYFKQYGKNWKRLASLIPTKNANQIKYYFQTNCQKLNLDKIEPEVKEEVVHKKRGRKPNAEKQRILAEKKAAEEAAKVAKAASLNMPRTSKIERASSSEENVNIDQEDSPGDSTSTVNLRTDESIQLDGDVENEEEKLNKLREEEAIRDFMPSPTIPKSFSSEDSLDIVEQDEASEEKTEQSENSNQPSSAQVEVETPATTQLEESTRKEVQMEMEQPQTVEESENVHLQSSEKTEIDDLNTENQMIENTITDTIITETHITESFISETEAQTIETLTHFESQIVIENPLTSQPLEPHIVELPSEPLELPKESSPPAIEQTPIIPEPTVELLSETATSDIAPEIPIPLETPLEPLQEEPIPIEPEVPLEKQIPMETSPEPSSMEGDPEAMQLESNQLMEIMNEVPVPEVPLPTMEEHAAMPVDSVVPPTSVPSISTMEGLSDFIPDASVETTCSTQATDNTTVPPNGSDGTVLG